MNKYVTTLLLSGLATLHAFGQANISPAPKQNKTIVITGGTIHIGNGQVIENGTIVFKNGKILSVGTNPGTEAGAEIIQAQGKHIYPGFIAPVTNLGLTEFESVKATLDFNEIGNMNPHIRSLIAYNTDSKVPATLRSNGILMAQITPEGGTIAGTSSVVQLDAWNWEDASIRTDDAIHINWPVPPRARGFGPRTAMTPQVIEETRQKAVNDLQQFFAEAQAYTTLEKHAVINTRFAAMKHLFDGKQQLFITANRQKDIVAAVNFAKSFGIKPVIVEAEEAYRVIDFLKANQISVIVKQPHALPSNLDDDVNLPYKNAGILAAAGIPVVISINGYWQQRNLPFMAGTAAAWGMDKEKALSAITLNTAKALGIDKQTGSLETGKDATLFISTGDALDMKTNHVEKAFIQGRSINLDNLHKQLDKKFSDKYSAKAAD
ncbi:amidohydrolase [Pedobacter antarcticus 4BY]|uniref:Amidohydrolase n=2 Tax=Pedobacter antarcticus TaxID=34086 RepID=A0A081PM16_9SPHI|nr:amidohydrolase family protein [Pedobacter antarcticus]KEQ31739.1 amidohydrolase [Pedobacter antarcticus 4BY]SFF47312.1 Imidazolonepropionase [Pedobacter antarcticus]